MIRPDQQQRGHQAERDRVPRERHALARAHAVGHGGGVHGRRPAAPAPRRRTHRRDGRSRETCRSSRRPATAARYRPARAARCGRGVTASSSVAARSVGTRPASAASMAGASLPISTTCRTLSRNAAASGAKSWPLPSPPAISTKRSRHAGDRRDGRADIGALRVIDVAHAARCRRPMPSGARVPGKASSASSMAASRQARRLARARAPPARWRHCAGRRSSCARCRAAVSPRRARKSCAPLRSSVKSASVRSMEKVSVRAAGAAASARIAHRRDPGVVGVQHHGRRLGKDSRLGVRIGRDRADSGPGDPR